MLNPEMIAGSEKIIVKVSQFINKNGRRENEQSGKHEGIHEGHERFHG